MRLPHVNHRIVLGATIALVALITLVIVRGSGATVVRLAQAMRDAGAPGVLLFVLVYVLGTIALFPGSILTLAAGFAYGPLWGLAIASPASVAGATAAFVLGRTLFRNWVERRMRASPQARAIDAAVEREGFKLVLLLRLSPLIPFDILNYVLSLSKLSLRTYVLASFIGMLPGAALYVYLGSLASTAAELSSAGAQAGPVRTVLYVGGLIATVLGVAIATRAARRALSHELRERAA